MDLSTQTPGPEVDGQPSIISFFAPGQLKGYPYLGPLRLLINAAFVANHCGPATNDLFPPSLTRLHTDDQLPAELGPETFTYVVSSLVPENGDPPRLYATCSGSPYNPKSPYTPGVGRTDGADEGGMQRTIALDVERNEFWELRMLVVNPVLQKQGLGGLLMTLVEGEIVRRSAETRLQLSKVESSPKDGHANGDVQKMNGAIAAKKLVLTLTTCKEVNEAYYLRRGWLTTELKPMGNLFNASRDWNLCWMQRDVSI